MGRKEGLLGIKWSRLTLKVGWRAGAEEAARAESREKWQKLKLISGVSRVV